MRILSWLIVLLSFKVLVVTSFGQQRDYPIRPVPCTDVRVNDAFWSPRMETNRRVTVWYDFKKCEETGRIDNFAKAAGLLEGQFQGSPYDDSDVYKVIEGAAYILAEQYDEKLDAYLDDLIAKISAAQEPDGYLYTARTTNSGHVRAGHDRWLNERGAQAPGMDSHELYNLGHLYEAATAHFQATGKRSLLDVALKSADLVAATWGPGKLEIPPGHQEIELGLVKLYRTTGEPRYLDLARFLLACRGNGKYARPEGQYDPVYYADHKPVLEQTEAVGHSVRATYMYAAMADIAALSGDDAYVKATRKLWDNVVGRKMYLTGGIGADASTEGFGPEYSLPNDSYNETCAAIGNALWNHRMFLLTGDGKYLDVVERVIHNGFLAGVGWTGDTFFYPNPLVSDGKSPFNIGSCERSPWFRCSCCPVNVVRFLPQIGGMIYASSGDSLYVNLFIGSSTELALSAGKVTVEQTTQMPWQGETEIRVIPGQPFEFTMRVRIPGWLRGSPVGTDLYAYVDDLKPRFTVQLNGQAVSTEVQDGFISIRRKWTAGDTISLRMDLNVRQVSAHPNVAATAGCVAFERGPLVYCAEGADNDGSVSHRTISPKVTHELQTIPNLAGTVTAIKLQSREETTVLIPYYAWCHRGPNEMRVWFPYRSNVR